MSYKEEVLKLKPSAKASFHVLGPAEWHSIRCAPYRDTDEIGYHSLGKEEYAWQDAYNKLTGAKTRIPVTAGPGAPDY